MRQKQKISNGVKKIKSIKLPVLLLIICSILIISGVFLINKYNSQKFLYDVSIPKTYNEMLKLNAFGNILTITPVNAQAVKVTKPESNVFKYIDAYQNTDIVQTLSKTKLKEDIILKKPGHPMVFKYRINTDKYDFKKDDKGNINFYLKGHKDEELYRIFTIPAPYMIDANNKKSSTCCSAAVVADVETSLSEDGILTLKINTNWLKQAAYPIILDPTIEINILNIHSSPEKGENWVVRFTTKGRADLRIIPDDEDTVRDDEFTGLYCGDQKTEPQILERDVIYYPNWRCNEVAKVVHYTLKTGHHTLRFEFGGETAYAYNAGPWEVDTATYDNKFKSVSATSYNAFFKPDGMKMYVVNASSDLVRQYALSTAWVVDTAVYDNKYKYVGSQTEWPEGLFFKPDGTKMYVVGTTDNKVFQYTLSAAWDVSTAVYNKYKSVLSECESPTGVFFKPDGMKMYVLSPGTDKVHQYALSTAWEVDTATYDNKFKSVLSEETIPRGVFFKPDGTKMYMVGSINDKVFQYTLSTAWDVSTADYDEKFKYVGSEAIDPGGVFFKPDGKKVYVVGITNAKVCQYSIPCICTPDEYRCNGNTYEQCDSGCESWNDVGCCQSSKCASGNYCKESNHTCTDLPLCQEANAGFGYNVQEDNEDHWGDCSASWNACWNQYQKRGPDGFCDGGGSCDTNDGQDYVEVGDVCQSGNSINPSGLTNCGTGAQACYCGNNWYRCAAVNNCTYNRYYVGFNNGSSCIETGKVLRDSNINNPSGYRCNTDSTTAYVSYTSIMDTNQCSGTDNCDGNTRYSGYTCDSGSCSTPNDDIGCCQHTKCPDQYCSTGYACTGYDTCGERTGDDRGQDPQESNEDLRDECGIVQCDGGAVTPYYHGWASLTCYYRLDVTAANAKCDGTTYNCATAPDYCPTQGQDGSTGMICDCEAAQENCSSTTAGTCDNAQCVPDIPTINYPSDGATGIVIGTNLAFNYSDPGSNDCTKYDLKVDDNADFLSLVIDEINYSTEGPWASGTVIHYPDAPGLSYSTKYYWKARVYSTNWSNWSNGSWDFTTTSEPSPAEVWLKGGIRLKGGTILRTIIEDFLTSF